MAALCSFSRVGEGRCILLDVRQLLDSAIRMAHGEIRCRARVTTRYAQTPPVLGNEGRLGQVFLNIVVNAAQAIPEGNIDANEITITTNVDASGRVVVQVSDTGVGIPPGRLLGKIFPARS